jgi:hypothetical protein
MSSGEARTNWREVHLPCGRIELSYGGANFKLIIQGDNKNVSMDRKAAVFKLNVGTRNAFVDVSCARCESDVMFLMYAK